MSEFDIRRENHGHINNDSNLALDTSIAKTARIVPKIRLDGHALRLPTQAYDELDMIVGTNKEQRPRL